MEVVVLQLVFVCPLFVSGSIYLSFSLALSWLSAWLSLPSFFLHKSLLPFCSVSSVASDYKQWLQPEHNRSFPSYFLPQMQQYFAAILERHVSDPGSSVHAQTSRTLHKRNMFQKKVFCFESKKNVLKRMFICFKVRNLCRKLMMFCFKRKYVFVFQKRNFFCTCGPPYVSVSLIVCMSVYLPAWLSVFLSVCLSVYVSLLRTRLQFVNVHQLVFPSVRVLSIL